MINIYIVSAFICVILAYITYRRAGHNQNKLNLENIRSSKITGLKLILMCFTPTLNIVFLFTFLYFALIPKDKFINEFNNTLNKN